MPSVHSLIHRLKPSPPFSHLILLFQGHEPGSLLEPAWCCAAQLTGMADRSYLGNEKPEFQLSFQIQMFKITFFTSWETARINKQLHLSEQSNYAFLLKLHQRLRKDPWVVSRAGYRSELRSRDLCSLPLCSYCSCVDFVLKSYWLQWTGDRHKKCCYNG